MVKPEFSIILNSYNPDRVALHTTMAALAAITKFTDDPYEIIVVDNTPDGMETPLPIRDDYKVLHPYTYILNKKNKTAYHCYNQGAKKAKSDKLVFTQNDVFVHERTINKLVKYLDKYDIAFPQQVPISRADVKQIYTVPDGGKTHIGGRDAGMIAMTREAFDKCGGWDERFHNLLGDKAFFLRWDKAGLAWTPNTNAFITHIMAGTNLAKDPGFYNEEMDFDAKLMIDEYEPWRKDEL